MIATGSRQVGKSTMLRMCFPKLKYINLDKANVLENAIDNPSAFIASCDEKVIIDEIQKAPISTSGLQKRQSFICL